MSDSNIPQHYVFVCSECHSDQILDPFKNTWVQNGLTPPCRYCGGVTVYVEGNSSEQLQELRSQALRQLDARRTGNYEQ